MQQWHPVVRPGHIFIFIWIMLAKNSRQVIIINRKFITINIRTEDYNGGP